MFRVALSALILCAALRAQYTGSARCRDCHAEVYARWSRTRMANVVRDPRVHPDAIIPDLSQPNPLVTFKRDDIAFVYGSKWKQRYFTKVGNDYFPLGAQWDIANKVWRPYIAPKGADWWVAYYPADNMKRPTGPLCDGCHSVNYNLETHQVTEWNVGCEKCHGPGAAHAAQPSRANIVNPARMDSAHASDVCIQCHSQGRPRTNPIGDRYYDWPVGYEPGRPLEEFWQLEDHKLGETTFTHFADGTAHKNRMQGNDFVQSAMYTHGVACFSCHDVHGTANNADLIKPASVMCLECHGPHSPNGPRGASIGAHTHHKAGSSGNECTACHMPAIEQTIANVNVRAHTFRFVTPAEGARLKIPDGCGGCHGDKGAEWATAQLKSWFSPWRME
ncbi:MAG: cytochrome C [Acidobacteria bacterium]|nr:cytochrome C [Acidobacteriota bacterium]